MKRRSFFASAAALFAAPVILKEKPEQNVFNLDILEKRKNELQLKNYGKGQLYVRDEAIDIVTTYAGVNIGDIISTDKSDLLYVYGKFDRESLFCYMCRELRSPKIICGKPVVMIDGKWRLYKFKITEHYVPVIFTTTMRTFKEVG